MSHHSLFCVCACTTLLSVLLFSSSSSLFQSEFSLIESKELQPLQDLITTLMGKEAKGLVGDGASGSTGAGGPAAADTD
jgi:hypothetical protein